jgi:CheY-like chemotaxis protein
MAKAAYIFDDDEDIVFMCTWLLQEMGWVVHSQNNCNNILERLKEVKPSVILMDNRIPDTGGIPATQMIKADPELRTIPVIFFTANSEIKKLSEEAKADIYLAKPFDILEFEQLINSFP